MIAKTVTLVGALIMTAFCMRIIVPDIIDAVRLHRYWYLLSWVVVMGFWIAVLKVVLEG